jgi:hypothetical protein
MGLVQATFPAFVSRFDERKTAAAAGVLLLEAGGAMDYIRLIKLLYLADRESWLRFNRPITGDSYVSMKYGPVLSRTLDLVKSEASPEDDVSAGPWARLIARDRYAVRLKGQPDLGPLSDAEVEILKEAHRLFEQTDKWRLCDLTHGLPEWHDPQGSAAAIYPEDILKALGKSPEEMEEARQLAAEDGYLRQLLDVESK